MTQSNHFLFINEVYFGATSDGAKPDKTRDYLNKDFGRVLHGLIQHDVLTRVIISNPEKYAILANIRETFDHGLIVNLRKLVNVERKNLPYFTGEPGSCTGGDFIEDLFRLKKEELDEIIADTRECKDGIADLCFKGAQDAFSELQTKVQKFKSSNYYCQLVKENEGIGLHKNHKPVKRKVVKSETLYEADFPFPINRTVYRSKFELDVPKIAKCLNELSYIIHLYQTIMSSRGVSFYVPHNCSLKTYIEQCFTMFGSTEEFKSEIDATAQSVAKELGDSLKVAHWN